MEPEKQGAVLQHEVVMELTGFTENAQQAIYAARRLAERGGHPHIEPEHVLVALVEQPDGIVPMLLRRLEIKPASIATAVRVELDRLPSASGGAQPSLSPRLSGIIERANDHAAQLGDEYVSTEHFFAAVIA